MMAPKRKALELVPWRSMLGEITIPREVWATTIGDSDSRDEKVKRHGDFGSLRIFQQAWKNEPLLQSEPIRAIFDKWKSIICDAIEQMNHFPIQHMAEALDHAKKWEPIDRRTAMAYAFVELR
jgi:hypothetical protein